MKRKKAQVEKVSNGTMLAARARAEGNKWTDAEREKLGEQFMKLYKRGMIHWRLPKPRCSDVPFC